MLLTNLSISSITFKSDQDLDEYIGFNLTFGFEGDDYKFLTNEWELTQSRTRFGDCSMILSYQGTDQNLYVIKSENSKNKHEVEKNDLVSWIMSKDKNLKFPIKDFKDGDDCKKFKDISVEGLPAITSYLLRNAEMNEEQLKAFYKSLQLNFVKNDLENMSIKEAFEIKEAIRFEIFHGKFSQHKLFDEKKISEVSDKLLKSVRKTFEKDFGAKALELKKKKSHYCENLQESQKKSGGIFRSLLIFFKGLFGFAEKTETNNKFCEDLEYEIIPTNVQNYLNVFNIEGYTEYHTSYLGELVILKSDHLKNEYLHFSENIYSIFIENVDSANPTIKVYDAILNVSKQTEVHLKKESDFIKNGMKFYNKDLQRYKALIKGIDELILRGYVASNSGDTVEDKLVINLKKDLKDLRDLKEAFDDFTFKTENEINEEICTNVSKIVKELLLNSELNKKINFIDQDGIISQKVLLKFMAISGLFINIDVFEESRNLNPLYEKAVQILV